jgi:hypothetical protein
MSLSELGRGIFELQLVTAVRLEGATGQMAIRGGIGLA